MPLRQRVHLVGKAFDEVELVGLQSKHRKKTHRKLSASHVITAKYSIETFNDHVLIDAADITGIHDAFKNIVNIQV